MSATCSKLSCSPETIAAFMGISMFGAISWRRSNRWGALASLLVSSALFFWLTYSQHGVLLQWEAANFGLALAAGFGSLAVVSLLTAPEARARIETFYERLDRASRWDAKSEREIDDQRPGQELLFVHLFDLRLGQGLQQFYRRFRVDLRGSCSSSSCGARPNRASEGRSAASVTILD